MAVLLKIQYLDNYDPKWEPLHYKHLDDSGFDLRAAINTPIILKPLERALISAGIRISFEAENENGHLYEMQIRARSGLAAKYGIGVVNGPGTVDYGYRGEIKIPLINWGQEDFIIQPGDRIAQAVICPIIQAKIETVETVEDETSRGAGGFGSTGTR